MPELLERLGVHIRNLDSTHPLTELVGLNENKKCILLRKVLELAPRETSDDCDIKTFYKIRRGLENNSILSSMIDKQNRDTDRCLNIKHAATRRRVIRWRCSSKFLNGRCAIGRHENVSRRCVKECYRPYLRPKIEESFALALEHHQGDTYNILDHLLNEGMFKLFNKFFNELDNSPRSD
jgi:hypothetical protein